jgi:hypothetical protein
MEALHLVGTTTETFHLLGQLHLANHLARLAKRWCISHHSLALQKKKRPHNPIVDNTSTDIKGPAILDILFPHPMRILYCPIV